MSFSQLGLSDPFVRTLKDIGYTTPTPIQREAIPVILSGQDILAAAQTGTGKTASYALPMLEAFTQGELERKKRVRGLILVPTRELALQVEENITQYAKNTDQTVFAVYGGVDTEPQKAKLLEGVDVLVATPGRLIDLIYQKAIRFDELRTLVLDEADRMLDMGFIEDINKIIKRLPTERQTLLFSATLSEDVRFLAKTAIDSPYEIALEKEKVAANTIKQWLVTVDKSEKSALLSHILGEDSWAQALIFIRTKHGAAKLVSQLEKRGIAADSLHGDRSQAMRSKVLADFKAGSIRYLVATDIAARGIDIDELPAVVNYDLPYEPDDYVHRIGRTGRAGVRGEAVSLVSYDDFKNLCAIESRLDKLIERKVYEDFLPKKVVPVSVLNFVSKNKKKPSGKRPSAERRGKPVNNTRNSKPRSNQSAAKPSPWESVPSKK